MAKSKQKFKFLTTTINENQENPPPTQNLKPLPDEDNKDCLLNDSIQPPPEKKFTIDSFNALNEQKNNKLASLKKSLHYLSRVYHPNQIKNPPAKKVFKIMPLPNHKNSCFLNAAVQ